MRKVLEDDGQITSLYHDLGDRVVIEKVQDASAIIEANKRQSNDANGRMGEMVHIGRIPVVIMDQWIKEDGINYLLKDNMPLLMKKLHHPDNKFMKTHPGRFI